MAINNFNVGVGTTSQLTRYRYVATGGETSISGTDADGKTLSYTVGLEQVFLNGVNLVRGQDYTATNGTSVGSLTALVASDVVEVFAYVPFNIANALTVSTVDAKGDLLVGTGADAVGRLAVGTNGQTLIADSTASTGLKYSPVVAFSVYRNGTQSVTGSTDTKIQFNTETFDTNNNFDSTTNYRFTPTVAGYYQVSIRARFSSVSGAQICNVLIFKNGSNYTAGSQQTADDFGQSDRMVSVLVYMNGSSDYLEGYGVHTDTSARNIASGSTVTWFTGVLVREA
jgi:hypothetical protein